MQRWNVSTPTFRGGSWFIWARLLFGCCNDPPGVNADVRRSISADHISAKAREFVRYQRGARMMRHETAMLWREAEGTGHVEVRQRSHPPVEPVERPRGETVGPGEAGTNAGHTQSLHPLHRIVQPMILEVEPLHQPEIGRVLGEMFKRRLRRAILAQKAHVEMPVIG